MTIIERILTDDDLYRRLGAKLYAYFLRLVMVSREPADLPSALAWYGSMDDLGPLWGVKSKGGVTPSVLALEKFGLIVRVKGRSLGYRQGKQPSRIFIAYGGLPTPKGGYPQPPHSTDKTASLYSSPLHKSPMNVRHLMPLPSHTSELSTQASVTDDFLTSVDDVHQSSVIKQRTKTPQMPDDGFTEPSPQLLSVLADIGWHGAPPREHQHEALLLAHWLKHLPEPKRKRNPGAWLRRILSMDGEAQAVCAAEGLYDRPVETTTTHASIMSYHEWVELEIHDPTFAAKVKVEAQRRAEEKGTPLSMLLVRQIATEWLDGGGEDYTCERTS